MTTVFVTNKIRLPYEKAEKFGTVRYITGGFVNLNEVQNLSHMINKELFDSTPNDFLLLSGSNLVCVMVGFLWLRKHGRVNILHWDARTEEYSVIPMTDISLPILL